MKRAVFSTIFVVCSMCVGAAWAGDSPQWRGPMRDGKYDETGLLKAWSTGGPPVAWIASGLGEGSASVSVVADTIYVPGMLDDGQGYIFALNLDGVLKWKAAYGKETKNRQAPGPRSVPAIDGERLYIMSGLGEVSCLDATSGKKLWSVDTVKRFKGKMIKWSIAESLLVDGDKVFCTPGGKGASVAALDKSTGETVWVTEQLDDASGYCSPTVIEHGGRRIILTMTAKQVVGIDEKTGSVLWTHQHPTRFGVHAVTPVYADGMIYFTAGAKSGGGMLALSPDGSSVTLKWEDRNLDCYHHGVVLHHGYIYGTAHSSGRELLCLELTTGKVMWRSRDVTQGALVYADDMLYVYEGPKGGVVSLVKATPAGFERTGSFSMEEGTGKHWTYPTIANGRMYIRRGDSLVAYDVRAQ